ncbi:MAG: DUF1015 domain-containing protein [Ruminococcus sp.]|nr:DUF1015 domain-containing protein [Ruminococcus sp.]
MKTAFQTADILLPKKNIDMKKWSVIACDQFTYKLDYWQEVKSISNGEKSTIDLILPEVYLNDDNCDKMIENINNTMKQYINEDIFVEYKDCFVYVERIQSDGKKRCGLIGKIDLEQYDYTKGSTSQVRATETTVIERIPPRLKVRKNAPIELTHIMILIDDIMNTVIEPIGKVKDSLNLLYDTGSGHISGYLVNSNSLKCQIDTALFNLLQENSKKYNLPQDEVLLYAMGDGNHSLATAKENYEQLKKENPNIDLSNHPARYTLVEIVNLHSDALEFEAIHRIVSKVNVQDLLSKMKDTLKTSENGSSDMQRFSYIINGIENTLYIQNPLSNLTVGSVQSFLDEYLKSNKGTIDYIHGKDAIINLSKNDDSIGFILPDMLKSELFPTVIKDGSLPRKTFSMGHAEDKRFYIECRSIVSK